MENKDLLNWFSNLDAITREALAMLLKCDISPYATFGQQNKKSRKAITQHFNQHVKGSV